MTTPAVRQAEEFLELLGTPAAPFLLDVREPDEFAEWAIPDAVNIPLGQLPSRLDEVPHDQSIVVICAKGARALAGAIFSAKQGVSVIIDSSRCLLKRFAISTVGCTHSIGPGAWSIT